MNKNGRWRYRMVWFNVWIVSFDSQESDYQITKCIVRFLKWNDFKLILFIDLSFRFCRNICWNKQIRFQQVSTTIFKTSTRQIVTRDEVRWMCKNKFGIFFFQFHTKLLYWVYSIWILTYFSSALMLKLFLRTFRCLFSFSFVTI